MNHRRIEPDTRRLERGGTRRSGVTRLHRLGVASVLSMMFIVLFGSLAAAMAVVAQGNLRTAASGIQVSRAMSAAETGLVFAGHRLESESRRFVVEKGVINSTFATKLWMGGSFSPGDGAVTVLPPVGYVEETTAAGIVHAVRNAHSADTHAFIAAPSDSALPSIDTTYGTLRVRPVALTAKQDGSPDPDGPYFRLKYELLADDGSGAHVRVTSQGVDGTVIRTLQMDFAITKRIEFAVISPNRIMIGKNVLVEGPLGSRYGLEAGEMESANGNPLVMRSDFYHLDPALDAKLDVFFDKVAQYDVDGDGRLRVNHPTEKNGITGTGFTDATDDGYIDDFDIFLAHFDTNGDGMVVYDSAKAAAAGLGGLSVEFTADPQLARLIDTALRDRDGDGEFTFSDIQLGYDDGVIDARDLYAKVRGRLAFAVKKQDWEAARGESYQKTAVHGPVRTSIDKPPVKFEVGEEDMLEISTAMVALSQSWFDNHSNSGAPFGDHATGQVAANLAAGGEYFPPVAGPWEEVPYGSVGAYDYYQRPVYRNMTFNNVRIPMGTNALFENCTFVGVTFIEIEEDCSHPHWNFAGARTRIVDTDGNVTYPLSEYGSLTVDHPVHGLITDTKAYSNNIRFHNCTFLGTLSGAVPQDYMHWRNKIQMTGETRFYLDQQDEDLLEQPDAGDLIAQLASLNAAAIEEMEKSSILMPGWSMDVGSFVSDPTEDPTTAPKIKLKGIIIAGIMDIRGNADVFGTLMMTYRPVNGEGPLAYAPPDCYECLASFNTTIGYFGPDDGDGEGMAPDHPDFDGFGEITLRYNPDARLPDGIPWPVRAEPVRASYTEGGAM